MDIEFVWYVDMRKDGEITYIDLQEWYPWRKAQESDDFDTKNNILSNILDDLYFKREKGETKFFSMKDWN